ncbi:MAG TPA: hypothetical protein VII61_08060 [Ktedonobacteraceae bacterium]|jgi:hypothetical protein
MVSQNPSSMPATTSTPAIVTGRSVTALRWYMRITGVLLLLFMLRILHTKPTYPHSGGDDVRG